MRTTFRMLPACLVLAWTIPVLGADKKPADEQWVAAGKATGMVVNVEGEKGIVIKVKVPEINPGAVQNIANWQAELAFARDVNQRRNLMIQIANQQRNMYNYKDVDVNIAPTEDVKVRRMYPPEDFDDKGKPKKYTAKELRELKGPDPKQPGYEADMDALQPGQLVTVHLVRKKNAPKPKAGMKPEEAALLAAENQPTFNKIIIERPPAPMQ